MALGPDLWRLRALQSRAARRGPRADGLLRLVDRGLGVRPGHSRGDGAGPAVPAAPPAGQGGLLLLPDVQAPRRPTTTGTRWSTTRARRSCSGTVRWAARFRGRIVQLITGSTGLDDWEWGVTLFGVAPRRPQGVCVRDALRRGLGALRRVRALLDRHGRRDRGRARQCPRSAAVRTPTATSMADDVVVAGKLDAPARRDRAAWGATVVAFSGGADSALVARVATDVLGPDLVLCVTAVSPSLAPEELADCRALAAEWGLRWRTVSTPRARRPRVRRPTAPTAATTARRACSPPWPRGRGASPPSWCWA